MSLSNHWYHPEGIACPAPAANLAEAMTALRQKRCLKVDIRWQAKHAETVDGIGLELAEAFELFALSSLTLEPNNRADIFSVELPRGRVMTPLLALMIGMAAEGAMNSRVRFQSMHPNGATFMFDWPSLGSNALGATERALAGPLLVNLAAEWRLTEQLKAESRAAYEDVVRNEVRQSHARTVHPLLGRDAEPSFVLGMRVLSMWRPHSGDIDPNIALPIVEALSLFDLDTVAFETSSGYPQVGVTPLRTAGLSRMEHLLIGAAISAAAGCGVRVHDANSRSATYFFDTERYAGLGWRLTRELREELGKTLAELSRQYEMEGVLDAAADQQWLETVVPRPATDALDWVEAAKRVVALD